MPTCIHSTSLGIMSRRAASLVELAKKEYSNGPFQIEEMERDQLEQDPYVMDTGDIEDGIDYDFKHWKKRKTNILCENPHKRAQLPTVVEPDTLKSLEQKTQKTLVTENECDTSSDFHYSSVSFQKSA